MSKIDVLAAVETGTNLGKNADDTTHHLKKGSINQFNEELHRIQDQDKQNSKQDKLGHQLEYIATRRATEELVKHHVLPPCVVFGADKNEKEKCVIAGTTANAGDKELVVAVGRNADGKAKHVFTLDENGDYYTAKQDAAGRWIRGDQKIGNEAAFEAHCKGQADSPAKTLTPKETKCDFGGKIAVTGDPKDPSQIDITHTTEAHLKNAHFKKVEGKWQSFDDDGKLSKAGERAIKRITVDDAGQPTVVYEDDSKRTYLANERQVNTDAYNRVTSVIRPQDGCSINIKYLPYPSNEIDEFIVPPGKAFSRYPGQTGYTENGSGGGSYYTDAPTIDARTGEIKIRDNRGKTYNYT